MSFHQSYPVYEFSRPQFPMHQSPMAAWNNTAPARPSMERMALPALNLQRMTLQSPSVSNVVARKNVDAPVQSPTKKRVRALPNASKSITLDLLRPHFEKPLAEVAGMFGICMTLMKKICRKNGVPRWPHRQIRGLRKSIWSIEKALRCCESEAQKRSYNDHLQKQRAKLATILRGPDGPSRAAFDRILAEPCSPASEASTSPVHVHQVSPRPSVPSYAQFSLPKSLTGTFSPVGPAAYVSSGKTSGHGSPTIVKLPPIASLLLKKGGELQPQRTGHFSGSFHF
ncbi:Rwp-rk domain-containing protein [Globisporangium polare]